MFDNRSSLNNFIVLCVVTFTIINGINHYVHIVNYYVQTDDAAARDKANYIYHSLTHTQRKIKKEFQLMWKLDVSFWGKNGLI